MNCTWRKKNGYEGSSVGCPHCQQAAEFQDYRPKQPLSVFGTIRCCRAYYYCHRCGHGLFPWDQTVGLTPKRLTPAAEELVALAGTVCNSFAEAADQVLPKLSGMRVSEATTERTTEAAGARLGRQLQQGLRFGTREPWTWQRDAQGRTCAYVSLDLTGVPQQAPGGGAAEGRMPYVAMVYNAVPELPADSPYQPAPGAQQQARYLAGLYDLDELGLQLRRQAAQVGMDQADVWIGLSDGGTGLEHFVERNFPRDPVLILDFYHPAERLFALARLWHPRDEPQAEELGERWCQTMKQEGGAGIIAVLEGLVVPPRRRELQEKLTETLNYLRNQRHRMDDPAYQRNGWLIGSGSVESACKTVVGQRLKLAGMRWGADGTDAVCHLRALFKSERGQWDAFWQRQVIQPSRN
jgi:hypothetical protein